MELNSQRRTDRINLHIYPSNMRNESRIFKITKGIIEAGIASSVILVGKEDSDLPEHEGIDDARSIWRVPLTRFPRLHWKVAKVLRYFQWLHKIYYRFRKEPISMINCHSIYDLPAGVLLKKATGCLLIYDTHELETERSGLKGFLKKITKKIEKYAVKHIDHIFVVGDSIKKWYQETYKLDNISVLKNIPDKKGLPEKSNRLRETFNIPQSHVIYIYLGAFFYGRGIELLLNVFSQEDIQDHIIFMGFGELHGKIATFEKHHPNIHLLEAVPYEEIVQYTSGADVGFSLFENTCLSYYYSFPNKIFEYLMSGIPCIVSDFPDMGDFMSKHDCGWRVPLEEEHLHAMIKQMTKEDITQKQAGVTALLKRDDFGWDYEKSKMVKVYEGVKKK